MNRDPRILANMGERDCRWPIGPTVPEGTDASEQQFCCRRAPRRRYCTEHEALAYPGGRDGSRR